MFKRNTKINKTTTKIFNFYFLNRTTHILLSNIFFFHLGYNYLQIFCQWKFTLNVCNYFIFCVSNKWFANYGLSSWWMFLIFLNIMFHAPMGRFQLELIYYFTYFSTAIPFIICVFLSCRLFVVNTTYNDIIAGQNDPIYKLLPTSVIWTPRSTAEAKQQTKFWKPTIIIISDCPSQETEVPSTPIRPVENVALTTKGLQERKTKMLDGTTVEK